jgi:hypothetical protein
MVTALAYYAMFTGLYQAIFFLTYRGLVRLAFHSDPVLGYFVEEGLNNMHRWLEINAIVGVVGFIFGWGLLERCEWARRGWLLLTYLLCVINIVRLLALDELNFRMILFIATRVALVALFTWILMRKRARDEFASSTAIPKTGATTTGGAIDPNH